MFGQQNNKHHDDNKIPDNSIDGAMADNTTANHQNPTTKQWHHPGQPLDDNTTQGGQTPPEVIAPNSTAKPNPISAASVHSPAHQNAHVSDSAHDLIDIKQKALGQLSPLVGHLDQSPEDKFRTTMMMIQASDDQSLVQQAYDAAQQIQDEKIRAQALLDIVNEINYFTQHQNN